ncbi:MAG: MFS transporter [Bdellovibrionaceae bacterium]|nr:MFS transporter [Pseudobdellovibrionaceae bacterium]
MNKYNNGKNGLNNSNRISKTTFSWALYDWANSAFATTVMAGFFPLFFKQYWSGETSLTKSTFYLGITNSIASLLLALLAPYLGVLADLSHRKKYYLASFAFLGIIATAGLYFVSYGQWTLAILLYALSTLGFLGGNIFYDALLPQLTTNDRVDFLSGFGFALGYLGGGILFALNVFMTLNPSTFGLSTSAEAVRISFLMVAVWWFVFSIPLFLNVRENSISIKDSTINQKDFLLRGFYQLWLTSKELFSNKSTLFFLLAYLFYIDGVNTIIKMAVDYGLNLGFDSNNLITALLITQFVGFPAAILFGWLGEKWGATKGIFLALISYCGITIWGYKMTSVTEFYYLAIGIGLVQGGIQSLSRSHFSKLIPSSKEAEYFGFFNMVGKTSAIFGPLLVGYVSMASGDPRLSILVILVFFIIGGSLLWIHKKKS